MPQLFVITGANGAGKSTLAKILLPAELAQLEVFDGDKFFVQTLSNVFPAQTKSPKYARQIAFEETVSFFNGLVETSLQRNESFAYEGHFSSEAPWETIFRFRDAGYRIVMVFLMVSDLSISMQRVTERVKTGGHFVTPIEVEKNFFGNLIQLNNHLELMDELIVIDNSIAINPTIIAHVMDSSVVSVANILPDWFKLNLPNLIHILKTE